MQYPNDLSTAIGGSHNTDVNKVANNLRALMTARAISENRLATETGVPQPTIHRVTAGKAKDPRDGTLRPLADYFGVTVEQLRTSDNIGSSPTQTGVADGGATYGSEQVAHSETRCEYVRVQQLDAEAGMGGELVNDDNPEVVRAMDFTPSYIRGLVGFLPPPGRLVLITGRGDSMIPVIQPGDVVMVDTGTTSFDGDGIYLINTGGGHQIKALQHRGDAIYVVSANAGLYPAFPLPRGAQVGGKVYLRTRIERFN